jgi:hypothetical protein
MRSERTSPCEVARNCPTQLCFTLLGTKLSDKKLSIRTEMLYSLSVNKHKPKQKSKTNSADGRGKETTLKLQHTVEFVTRHEQFRDKLERPRIVKDEIDLNHSLKLPCFMQIMDLF